MWIRHRLQNSDGAAGGGGGGGGGGAGASAGAGGGGAAPWYGEIPADRPTEFRDWATNKNFADPQTALLSHFNLEKLVGFDKAGRTVVKPKDANDAEGLKAWRAGIGVPEKEDDYQFPDALKDDPLVPALRAAAFKHGIPAEALKSALPEILQAAAANDQRLAKERDNAAKAGLAELETEWGAAFPTKKEAARRGALAFTKGMDAETAKLFSDAAEVDPRFMRGFAAFGEMIAEHSFEGGGGGNTISIAQARDGFSALQKERADGKVTDREYWERRKPLDAILERAS